MEQDKEAMESVVDSMTLELYQMRQTQTKIGDHKQMQTDPEQAISDLEEELAKTINQRDQQIEGLQTMLEKERLAKESIAGKLSAAFVQNKELEE